MRDIETIDAELRLLSPSEQIPSTESIDQLLDERSNAATTAGC